MLQSVSSTCARVPCSASLLWVAEDNRHDCRSPPPNLRHSLSPVPMHYRITDQEDTELAATSGATIAEKGLPLDRSPLLSLLRPWRCNSSVSHFHNSREEHDIGRASPNHAGTRGLRERSSRGRGIRPPFPFPKKFSPLCDGVRQALSSLALMNRLRPLAENTQRMRTCSSRSARPSCYMTVRSSLCGINVFRFRQTFRDCIDANSKARV